MITERATLNTQLKMILDSLCVILAFFVSYYLRKPITTPPFYILAPIETYIWLLLIGFFSWWGVLLFFGIYSTDKNDLRSSIRLICRATFTVLLLISLVFFLFNITKFNRTLVLPFILLSPTFMIFWRVLEFRSSQFLAKPKRILIVGDGERAKNVIQNLRKQGREKVEIVGCLAESNLSEAGKLEGVAMIGDLTNLNDVLHQQVVDEVIISLSLSKLEHSEDLFHTCELLGVNVLFLIDPVFRAAHVDIGKAYGVPFLAFNAKTASIPGLWMKAAMDRLCSLILLALLAPLMLLIAVLVKATSAGPVFFIQERAGFNGRKFRMYKFRTMFANAEVLRAALEPYNEMSWPAFKLRRDPRVTAVGRILRRTSLDELPQLINVLKGDMSLVGPRPLPWEAAVNVTGGHRRRLRMKPGITCT